MTNLQSKLKRLAEKETALGAVIILLYRVCKSVHFQAAVNFILTLLIGKFTFTEGHNVNWSFVIPIGCTYIIMNLLFITANNIEKQNLNMHKVTSGCLKEITTIAYTIRESVAKNRKLYLDSKNKDVLLNYNPFYTCAVSVCESIYYLLSKVYNHQRFKVTIFQQFIRKNKSRYIKIIAYKSHENKRPKCFYKELPLFKNGNNKMYVVKLFESNSPDIVCFNKKEQIDEVFVKVDNCRINTRQYIGIPCQAEGDYISFVIQISSYDEKMFSDVEQMKELGEQILVSYRELLALINEQKLINDNIICNDGKVVSSSVSNQDTRAEDKGKTFETV